MLETEYFGSAIAALQSWLQHAATLGLGDRKMPIPAEGSQSIPFPYTSQPGNESH